MINHAWLKQFFFWAAIVIKTIKTNEFTDFSKRYITYNSN